MNEQEHANQLAQQLDRLLSGGTADGNDPLLDVASTLAGESLQPPDRSAAHLEQRLGKWFGASKPNPQTPVSRIKPGPTVAVLVTAIVGIGVIVLSLFLIKDRPAVAPSLAITSPTASATVQATSVPATSTPGESEVTVEPTLPVLVITSTSSVPTNSNPVSADDSSDLPVTLNVSGTVQEITATTIGVNDLAILIPSGVAVPAGVQPGVSVTIVASLQNDDTVSALAISLGTLTPSAAPGGTPTMAALATVQASTDSTSDTDCDRPNQPLAVLISTAFNVSYDEVIGWHCKGFGFGEIMRAYLLAQKPSVTVDQVLALRAEGQGWGQIMKASGINPKDLAPGSTIRVTKGQGNGPKGTPPGKGKGKGDKGN